MTVASRRLVGVVPHALAVAALLALPSLLSTSRSMSLAVTALTYAVAGTGLGLLYGRMGYLSFAHPLLWGLGAYTSFILADQFDWGFWVALVPAMAVAAVGGALTGILGVRLNGHHFLLATFILALLFVVVAERLTSLTNGQQGILVARPPGPLLGFEFTSLTQYYYLCCGILLVAIAGYLLVSHSRVGRMFESIRENVHLAESLGIDTRAYVVLGFGLSGLFAGAGGALFAYSVKHIEPAMFGLSAAVLMALVVLLGGARYAWGPTVGSFVVVFAREIVKLEPSHQEALNGFVLIFIILLMPAGAIGAVNRLATAGPLRRGPAPRPVDLATGEVTGGDH